VTTESRERVLHEAEHLFMTLGYRGVTMRRIAERLGMKQSSLYFHAPGGKADLFVQVVQRRLDREREGLEKAIEAAGSDLDAQVQAAAVWMLSQPPMSLLSMLRTDLAQLDASQAMHLAELARTSIFTPLMYVFEGAAWRGELHDSLTPQYAAGYFLAALEGTRMNVPEAATNPETHARNLTQIILHGITP